MPTPTFGPERQWCKGLAIEAQAQVQPGYVTVETEDGTRYILAAGQLTAIDG
ncbi:MAG TPA: hypothetical protein VFR11_11745 [Micromonosporaceae bacterium]|jgi:hypothetical protein|nr:hypothetical protein [Micromonosporaceae bacterium]